MMSGASRKPAPELSDLLASITVFLRTDSLGAAAFYSAARDRAHQLVERTGQIDRFDEVFPPSMTEERSAREFLCQLRGYLIAIID